MSHIFDNIKRIKMLGKLFLAFSNNKIVIKDFDKPNEHVTMLFKSNGIIDIHKTKEGSEKEKEYESLGVFDLIKSVQKIVSDPTILENGVTEFAKSAREVTFEETEFEDHNIYNFKTSEEFLSIAKRKKKDITIPIEAIDEIFPFKDTIPWNDAREKIRDNALVLNKEGIPIGFLLKVKEKYLLFSINIMENPFVSKLISMMTNLEKFEPKKPDDT